MLTSKYWIIGIYIGIGTYMKIDGYVVPGLALPLGTTQRTQRQTQTATDSCAFPSSNDPNPNDWQQIGNVSELTAAHSMVENGNLNNNAVQRRNGKSWNEKVFSPPKRSC